MTSTLGCSLSQNSSEQVWIQAENTKRGTNKTQQLYTTAVTRRAMRQKQTKCALLKRKANTGAEAVLWSVIYLLNIGYDQQTESFSVWMGRLTFDCDYHRTAFPSNRNRVPLISELHHTIIRQREKMKDKRSLSNFIALCCLDFLLSQVLRRMRSPPHQNTRLEKNLMNNKLWSSREVV